ncbi:pyruvate kinase [Pajaroellobacter abortibovis]|uniref:Pyruvate kinase n=2 Tax=Pajaroellobacter abortibovis TaxID=1882918 RepID=A0A1L6MZ89_9BACT|nr:pyruvate kinase [Pajaroellobacter abortibovis]
MVRRSKLVCTLGPACNSVEAIKGLIEAGMDVARLNFSHGTQAEHLKHINYLREASRQSGKWIPALQDLCGPKMRTGQIPERYELKVGTHVTLIEGNESSDPSVIPIPYEGLANDVRPFDTILFDDGRIVAKIAEIKEDRILASIVQGGTMRSYVGVHLPSRTMRVSALTEKDRDDLHFGLEQGVDFVALSFVRRDSDIKFVRQLCAEWNQPTPIIAKIETPDAVENLESIMIATDGVMVARGDLGVEFPPEQVPIIQKKILNTAKRVQRPVIVATEMLQSMTAATRPTRAEASDVANAIFSGTDALMLSGETATGAHPALVTMMMSRIATAAETSLFLEEPPYSIQMVPPHQSTTVAEAIARGACKTAQEIGAKFLVAFTETGSSAIKVSLARPYIPIIAFSPNPRTRRQMGLYWGVIPREAPPLHDMDALICWCTDDLLNFGFASPNDKVVMVFGAPFGVSGSTNSIRVHML